LEAFAEGSEEEGEIDIGRGGDRYRERTREGE